jgi:capsular exopolysaccharide synthesis family protein
MKIMIPTIVSETYEETINFQKYWLVLKRRWLPATAIFVTVTGAFLLAALLKQPTYEAEAQLLIGTDKSSKLIGLEDERGEIEILGKDSNPVATEAEIIQSRPIIEKVIKQLNLKNDKGKFLEYQEIASNLDVKPIVGTDVLQVFYQDSDPELAALIINKVIKIYEEEDSLNNRAAAVSARQFIKAQLPKVELTVAKAEADLRRFKTKNKIANLSQEATNNIDTIQSLESEIETVNTNLEEINARFEQLRSQLNINWEEAVAISSLGQSAMPQLISELQKVRIDLVNQRDRFSENAPQIISLQERELELETLLEKQIGQIQGDKQVGLLKNKILNISASDSSQQMITELANMGVERIGLVKKSAALKSNLQARKQNLENLPLLEEEQRELERRVQATQSTYQTLLSQLQETQVTENQNVGNVRIIADAAIPKKPISSMKNKLIVLMGSAMGAIFGTAFAFLIDLSDKSIKTSKEAEEIFGYPLQGLIPDFAQLAGTRIEDRILQPNASNVSNTSSLVSPKNKDLTALRSREAYQMLQANLKFLSTDWDRKVIAITSSVPQEGKSEVATNLAKSMAQLGKTVLLIDADLRRPSQHHIWGLNNSIGLSDVLLGEAKWEEQVQSVIPNFDVLTAGSIPDNPVLLLNSQQMRNLTETMRQRYDCIILDTPPITGMADTLILSSMVDGLLLVVRPGVVDHESAIAVKKLLANIEQHVFGIVVNGVNLKHEPYAKSYF